MFCFFPSTITDDGAFVHMFIDIFDNTLNLTQKIMYMLNAEANNHDRRTKAHSNVSRPFNITSRTRSNA